MKNKCFHKEKRDSKHYKTLNISSSMSSEISFYTNILDNFLYKYFLSLNKQPNDEKSFILYNK